MQTDCQPTVIATTPLKKHEYSRVVTVKPLGYCLVM